MTSLLAVAAITTAVHAASSIDWTALRDIVTTIGVIATGYFSYASKRQGKVNQTEITKNTDAITSTRDAVNTVHDKVNGNLEAAVAAAEDRARRITGPRVLLVDDDPDDLFMARRPLAKFGCEVFEAKTAAQAEALLMANIGAKRGYPFDFVLLDLRIPFQGSSEVFKLFNEKAPKVPIVVLTGQTFGAISTDISNIPRIWIQKPLNEMAVRSLLDQYGIPYTQVEKATAVAIRREGQASTPPL